MVHGDSEQTLRVLIAYYRQKTESLMYTAALAKQDKLKSDSVIASLSISKKDKLSMHKPVVGHVESEHKDRINYELSHERTSQFCNYVDGIYHTAIMNHFKNWHDPSASIIDNQTVERLLLQFESFFPMTEQIR